MAGPAALKPADVKFIAVHCSATPPSMDIGAKELDRMHRQRGFRAIGYHKVIRRDGTVEDGRPLTERGAHVEDWNHCSIGICLVGGVDSKMKPQANFTPAQFIALEGLLKGDLMPKFPGAVVQGHRDFPNVAKACPSFNVRRWLDTAQVIP
jgi:N-acetylmuramoyl-L-alanine amidase